jgi:hypothetical protein
MRRTSSCRNPAGALFHWNSDRKNCSHYFLVKRDVPHRTLHLTADRCILKEIPQILASSPRTVRKTLSLRYEAAQAQSLQTIF